MDSFRRFVTCVHFLSQVNHILQDKSAPARGEERLAALTAGERTAWALARQEFFSSGVNRTSLEAVDKAAFFVTLDDFPYEYHQVWVWVLSQSYNYASKHNNETLQP